MNFSRVALHYTDYYDCLDYSPLTVHYSSGPHHHPRDSRSHPRLCLSQRYCESPTSHPPLWVMLFNFSPDVFLCLPLLYRSLHCRLSLFLLLSFLLSYFISLPLPSLSSPLTNLLPLPPPFPILFHISFLPSPLPLPLLTSPSLL